MTLTRQVRRQPHVHRVISSQHPGAQQAREYRRAAQRRGENIQKVCLAATISQARIERRFLHPPAHIDDEQRGGDADPEQHAPSELGRQQRVQTAKAKRRRRPADRPAALHEPDGLAAMARRDGLGDQYRPDRPFAAEAEALQRARDEKRGIGMRETAQSREHGEPGDGPLQDAHPAVAIGEDARGPAADGRGHQRAGGDVARLRFAHVPHREQGRHDEGVDHEIEAVEAVAQARGEQRMPLGRGGFSQPHRVSSGRVPASSPIRHRPSSPRRREGYAVDECAALRIEQQSDCLRDILRARETRHGHAIHDVRIRVGAAALIRHVHLGLDPAGAHRIDSHAAPAPLRRQGPGQADQTVLRGVVGAAMSDPRKSRDRSDVDDAAASARQHLRAQVFAQ